jgi:hypothetical protein
MATRPYEKRGVEPGCCDDATTDCPLASIGLLTEEIISAVARFFEEGRGPSHDELTRLFRRNGLQAADPATSGDTIGKMKRVREVLSYALDTDPEAGDRVVVAIIGTVKARGGFRRTSDAYAGDEVVNAARDAFRVAGFELDPEGNLHQALLSDLQGVAATEALRAYVRRAHSGSEDAALVLGTGKELAEATARHVLVERTGTYPTRDNFPMTLYQAFATAMNQIERLRAIFSPPPSAHPEFVSYVANHFLGELQVAECRSPGRPIAQT